MPEAEAPWGSVVSQQEPPVGENATIVLLLKPISGNWLSKKYFRSKKPSRAQSLVWSADLLHAHGDGLQDFLCDGINIKLECVLLLRATEGPSHPDRQMDRHECGMAHLWQNSGSLKVCFSHLLAFPFMWKMAKGIAREVTCLRTQSSRRCLPHILPAVDVKQLHKGHHSL